MALLVGIILLIVVLCYRSIDNSVDRHYKIKSESDREFLSQWTLTDAEYEQYLQNWDQSSAGYKDMIEFVCDAFVKSIGEANAAHEWIAVMDRGVHAPYNFAELAHAAMFGKLPRLMRTRWDALTNDIESNTKRTAFYEWWLKELQKYGFPGRLFYRNIETKVCVPFNERPNGDAGNGGEYFFDYSGLPDDVLKKCYQRSI